MSGFFLPPTTPYLTDQLFILYGYFTGSSTYYQRQAGYRIAQRQVEQEIGTFIIPRTEVATIPFVSPNTITQLPIGKINSIDSVVLHELYSNNVERLISGTASIADPYNGYVILNQSLDDVSNCTNCFSSRGIYKATITLNAGYSTGSIVGNPDIELALCTASEIVITQMYDRGMGFEYWDFSKTTQIGRTIQTLSDKFLLDTAFGHSSLAGYIRTLLLSYKIFRVGKVGK